MLRREAFQRSIFAPLFKRDSFTGAELIMKRTSDSERPHPMHFSQPEGKQRKFVSHFCQLVRNKMKCVS
jgi:hypothetical protein